MFSPSGRGLGWRDRGQVAKLNVLCFAELRGGAGLRALEVAHTRVSPGLSGLSASFLQGESGKTVFSEQREESKDWHNLSGRGIVVGIVEPFHTPQAAHGSW